MLRKLLSISSVLIFALSALTGCTLDEIIPTGKKSLTAAELYAYSSEQLDESDSFNVNAEYSVSVTYLFMDMNFDMSEKAKGRNSARYISREGTIYDSPYTSTLIGDILYLESDGEKLIYHSPSYYNESPQLTDYMPILTDETLSEAVLTENEDGTKSFTVTPEVDEIRFMFDGVVDSAIQENSSELKKNDSKLTFNYDENNNLKSIDVDIDLTLIMADESTPGIKLDFPIKIEGKCDYIRIGTMPNISAPVDKDEYEDCGDW